MTIVGFVVALVQRGGWKIDWPVGDASSDWPIHSPPPSLLLLESSSLLIFSRFSLSSDLVVDICILGALDFVS